MAAKDGFLGKVAASIEDDVVASTSKGDVGGTRYPHVLNHVSLYSIPSIDEVLDLYYEPQSPIHHVPDLEPTYSNSFKPGASLPCQAEHKEGNHSLLASIARAYAGTNGPEVFGPGSQLYNLGNAFPPGLSQNPTFTGLAYNSSNGDFGNPNIYRKDSWESTSSVSDSDDSVCLSTIVEEPEPPELEADIDIVKPAFKARRQKDVLNTRRIKAKGNRTGVSGSRL